MLRPKKISLFMGNLALLNLLVKARIFQVFWRKSTYNFMNFER